MRLLAMVEEPASVARFLAPMGEATEVARRSPGRGPPYWNSRVLRRQALDERRGWASPRRLVDESTAL